jgi:hypothetical protein
MSVQNIPEEKELVRVLERIRLGQIGKKGLSQISSLLKRLARNGLHQERQKLHQAIQDNPQPFEKYLASSNVVARNTASKLLGVTIEKTLPRKRKSNHANVAYEVKKLTHIGSLRTAKAAPKTRVMGVFHNSTDGHLYALPKFTRPLKPIAQSEAKLLLYRRYKKSGQCVGKLGVQNLRHDTFGDLGIVFSYEDSSCTLKLRAGNTLWFVHEEDRICIYSDT